MSGNNLPPILALLALEEIKRYAGEDAIKQDTLHLRRRSASFTGMVDDNYTSGFAPKWVKRTQTHHFEYPPALVALQLGVTPPAAFNHFTTIGASPTDVASFASGSDIKSHQTAEPLVKASNTLEGHLKNCGLLHVRKTSKPVSLHGPLEAEIREAYEAVIGYFKDPHYARSKGNRPTEAQLDKEEITIDIAKLREISGVNAEVKDRGVATGGFRERVGRQRSETTELGGLGGTD